MLWCQQNSSNDCLSLAPSFLYESPFSKITINYFSKFELVNLDIFNFRLTVSFVFLFLLLALEHCSIEQEYQTYSIYFNQNSTCYFSRFLNLAYTFSFMIYQRVYHLQDHRNHLTKYVYSHFHNSRTDCKCLYYCCNLCNYLQKWTLANSKS